MILIILLRTKKNIFYTLTYRFIGWYLFMWTVQPLQWRTQWRYLRMWWNNIRYFFYWYLLTNKNSCSICISLLIEFSNILKVQLMTRSARMTTETYAITVEGMALFFCYHDKWNETARKVLIVLLAIFSFLSVNGLTLSLGVIVGNASVLLKNKDKFGVDCVNAMTSVAFVVQVNTIVLQIIVLLINV